MAISPKDLMKKINPDLLNDEELLYIKKIETYIDDEISKHFRGSSVHIVLSIPNCDWDPVTKTSTDFLPFRKAKLRKIIDSLYKKAGWKIRVHLDDGLDGPNISGPDYWILEY